jgi:hypothetical protein
MSTGKNILILVLLGAGCMPEPSDPQFDESSITLDEEPIQIVYDEATASIGVGLDIEGLVQRVEGSTIEIQVDVTTPDGIKTRHELDWTIGDDRALSGFGVPALSNGLYEVELTRLAIDGEMIDGMTARGSMRLLGARDEQQAGGQGGGECKKGDTINGSKNDDELYGSKNDDVLNGKEGDDELDGKECHDILHGGKGDDVLRGGKGKDELHGGKGKDECSGGQGADMFFNCEEVEQD